MSRTPLHLLIGVVCACGGAVKTEPASVPIRPLRAPAVAIEREDVEAARRRVLAALDGADLAAAASELAALKTPTATSLASIVREFDERHRPRSLANVMPVRVAAVPPPPAHKATEAKLVATRTHAPEGLHDAYWASRGKSYSEFSALPDKAPSWLPARVGDSPLGRLRPSSDGRWIALWAHRYLAIVGGPTTVLLDFGGWSDEAPAERTWIEDADVAGDVLYVTGRRFSGERFLVAVDTRSGKPSWRSQSSGLSSDFLIANDSIVVWQHGPSRGRPGELSTIRRDTGVTAARRATPELDDGAECHFMPEGGVVHCLPSSSAWKGKGLTNDESLEIQVTAPARLPIPPRPSNASAPFAIGTLPPPATADARVAAWRLLDAGEPRAAILALRTSLGERPTDVAALALDEIARAALDKARADAAEEILARHPSVVASETPSGNAPVRRSRTRRLVTSRRSITPEQMPSEFPQPTDDDLLPPAWVPEKLGARGRNADAGLVLVPNQRVEVYWGYGAPSMTVAFTEGKVASVFEHAREVRAAGAIGDVLLTAAGNGAWFLEAHDMKTGRLFYRSKEQIHDQYFVVEDGYVVASTAAKPNADIVLIEADTGKVAGRANMPPPQDAFLVFRKDKAIMAVNTRSAVTVTLE